MKTKTVYYIDEDDIERNSFGDVLKEIFEDTSIVIEAIEPLDELADYAAFILENPVSAFILDQRLDTAGDVTYTGALLATHLRTLGLGIPIVIFTNFPSDDFTQNGWAVESVSEKRTVAKDPNSESAKEFKARLKRHIDTSIILRSETNQRFHELLVKNLDGQLTEDEKEEFKSMESERVALIAASEQDKSVELDSQIEKLKELLEKSANG